MPRSRTTALPIGPFRLPPCSQPCAPGPYLALVEGPDDVFDHGKRGVVLKQPLWLALGGQRLRFRHLEVQLSAPRARRRLELHRNPQRGCPAGHSARSSRQEQRHKGVRLDAQAHEQQHRPTHVYPGEVQHLRPLPRRSTFTTLHPCLAPRNGGRKDRTKLLEKQKSPKTDAPK